MGRAPRWIGWWFAAWALLLSGLALTGAARAQDVQPVPMLASRVIDQTATLTPAQTDALVAKLAALETTRGAQLVVLIVPSTQPEDIASYAQRVADAWKIGRRQVGDGLLIVVAKEDRKVRIEVAKSLEGAVPDVLAGRIIREQISPAFKAGDYAGGLNLAVDKLSALIAGEALAPPQRQAQRNAPSAGFDWQDMAIFLFVGVPIVGAVLSGIFGRKLGALLTGGAVGGLGWFLTTSLLVAGGAGLVALFLVGVMGVGGGGSSRRSGGLGNVLAGGLGGMLGSGGFSGGRGGGGGGGFSSGGGGDFGGGGASGDW